MAHIMDNNIVINFLCILTAYLVVQYETLSPGPSYREKYIYVKEQQKSRINF